MERIKTFWAHFQLQNGVVLCSGYYGNVLLLVAASLYENIWVHAKQPKQSKIDKSSDILHILLSFLEWKASKVYCFELLVGLLLSWKLRIAINFRRKIFSSENFQTSQKIRIWSFRPKDATISEDFCEFTQSPQITQCLINHEPS